MLTSRTKRIILGLIIGLLVLAATLWWLSSVPPRWYQPPDAHDAEANELAALVEHRLAEEMHRIRDDNAPWQLRIREEQINAWLATRMSRWLEHEHGMEWPSQLGTPQVRFDRETISIALPAEFEQLDDKKGVRARAITLTLTPYLDESEIRFKLIGIRIGRLPSPGDPMDHVARLVDIRGGEGGDDLAHFFVQLVTGQIGVAPVIKLVDRRQVRLSALHLDRGVMDVSAVTERAQLPEPE